MADTAGLSPVGEISVRVQVPLPVPYGELAHFG